MAFLNKSGRFGLGPLGVNYLVLGNLYTIREFRKEKVAEGQSGV